MKLLIACLIALSFVMPAQAKASDNIISLGVGSFDYLHSGSGTNAYGPYEFHNNEIHSTLIILNYQRQVAPDLYMGFSIGNNNVFMGSFGVGF